MSFLISNASQAADFGMERAKASKKQQMKVGQKCGPNCIGPAVHSLQSQFLVIRDGVAEIVFTVDDDGLWPGFAIAARFFSGHIISMLIDEETDAGTHRMIVGSVDRRGSVEWREAPYDVSSYGIAWGAVQRVERPTGMTETVNQDLAETMTEPSAEDVMAMMNKIIQRRPDFSMAQVRAATDLATIHMVQDLAYCPLNTVMLIAMPDSQRLAALSNRGIQVIAE